MNAADATPVVVTANHETHDIDAGVNTAGVSLSIGDATVVEGDSGTAKLRFTVRLSAATTIPVTVHYATVDGTATAPGDYATATGTITLAPGQTTKVVSVNVKGETTDEVEEQLEVVLSAAVGAALDDFRAIGSITDDDP